MKFLAAFVLSLSLLVSSSFAVSLTPPMVLAMEEDRSMESSNFESNDAEPDFNAIILQGLVGGTSIGIGIGGFGLTIVGFATKNNEQYNHKDSKIAIGVGIGMMVLGVVGIIWAF